MTPERRRHWPDWLVVAGLAAWLFLMWAVLIALIAILAPLQGVAR